MKLRLIAMLLVFLLLFTGCNAVSDPSKETQPSGTESQSAESDTDKIKISPQSDTSGEEKQESEDDGILKIITIGNSFSDDTMQYVYQIAKDAGYEDIKLGNLYIGGCSLDKHAANAKGNKAAYEYRVNTTGRWSTIKDYRMSDALRSENWDIVSLQQASGSSGIESTYSQLEYMIGYVKKLVPGAKIVWNMTWAYQQDSTHSEFSKYNGSQSEMYASILSAVKETVLDNADISIAVPVGTAIQNARTSYVGDALTRDGFHLTLYLGRYIAGLTFFGAVTGVSIENITYKPSGVDEDMQKVAIESAMNAIAEPWKITESQYITK